MYVGIGLDSSLTFSQLFNSSGELFCQIMFSDQNLN